MDDRWIGVIGIAMALVLVLSGARLRRIPHGAKAWMALAWTIIIAAAAFAFREFHR